MLAWPARKRFARRRPGARSNSSASNAIAAEPPGRLGQTADLSRALRNAASFAGCARAGSEERVPRAQAFEFDRNFGGEKFSAHFVAGEFGFFDQIVTGRLHGWRRWRPRLLRVRQDRDCSAENGKGLCFRPLPLVTARCSTNAAFPFQTSRNESGPKINRDYSTRCAGGFAFTFLSEARPFTERALLGRSASAVRNAASASGFLPVLKRPSLPSLHSPDADNTRGSL